MGHRQLALVFGAVTAIIGLAIAAIRMMLDFYDGISVGITAVVFVASSIVLLLYAKKKWDLGYMNAFAMLFSASIICSLIYAFGYSYAQDALDGSVGKTDVYAFGGLVGAHLLFKLPIDAIVAIFQKR